MLDSRQIEPEECDRRPTGMRILLLSAWFPDPPSNGSRQRIAQLLRALAPAHEVTLLSFADQPDVDPASPAVRAVCRGVHVVPAIQFDPRAWCARIAFVSPRPRSVVATHSRAMAAAVRRALGERTYDVIIASQLACAGYAPEFRGVRALFEEVELGAFQVGQSVGVRRWRRAAMWAKYAHHLRVLRHYYRAFTVVSEPERRLLAAVLGDTPAIDVVPNGVAAAEYGREMDAAQPDTVVFTGSLRYGPNYDAMRWFLSRVWPRVQRARPAARLFITGSHGDLPLPAAENVVRTGFMEDIRPLLASSWVAVAPILSGGGTRIKILEAMASRTPVVATTKGAEGLAASSGEHLLLADEPVAFAEHILALLGDPLQRARLGEAGRALVEERYDWGVLGRQFEGLVRAVAAA